MKPIIIFLIVASLLIAVGGVVYYKKSQTLGELGANNKNKSTPAPTPPPLKCLNGGIYDRTNNVCVCQPGAGGDLCEFNCNGGTPIFDENNNFVRCDCGRDGGKFCQYTSEDYCRGRGIPKTDENDNFTMCSCDNSRFTGKYCCDTNNLKYTYRNKCSDNAICTDSKMDEGWVIEKKECDKIDMNSPDCASLCGTGVDVDKNLRCSKGVASCDTSSPYKNDVFLNALYYPPNERDKNKMNNKYWLTLKTDRDLKEFISSDGRLIQGKYGSFFIVFKFQDGAETTPQRKLYNPNSITNGDLNNAINSFFTDHGSLAFDNFGNIKIEIGDNMYKTFQNPSFPISESETLVIEDNDTKCRDQKYGYSNGKCNKYKFDQVTTGLLKSGEAKAFNKNFITSTNKKWILYNDKINDKNQYYVLYNPMQSLNYKQYYEKNNRQNRKKDFLIQKYGEIAATPNTYGISNRNYGDYTANCFGGYRSGVNNDIVLPDCVGDTISHFQNPLNFKTEADINSFNKLKGSCACANMSCSNDNIMVNGDQSNDSFLSKFKDDIATDIFPMSSNNNGRCPANLTFNICSSNTSSSGDLKMVNSEVKVMCGANG